MRTKLLAILLYLGFGTAPTWAGPGACQSEAWDEAGQSVRVKIAVDEDGKTISREAFWELGSPDNEGLEGLSLDIGYVAATRESLGPPTSVDLNFVAIQTQPDLKGARGKLELSPTQSWSAPYQGFFGLGFVQLGVKTPWGGRRNPELVEIIESAEQAKGTLFAGDGSILASLTHNLADHVTRDRLFQEASAEAQRLADAPAPCVPPTIGEAEEG